MKWVHFLHRDMSVLFEYFAQRAGVEYIGETLKLPGFQLKGRKIDHSEIYHDENELAEFRKKVEAKGQDYLEFLASGCEAQCIKLVETAKNPEGKPALELFEDYCDEQMRLMSFLPLFPGVIEHIIPRQLDEIIQRYSTSEMDADKLLGIIQKPSKPYTITHEKVERYRLGAIIQRKKENHQLFMKSEDSAREVLAKDAELRNELDNYISSFGWMETRHFKGDVWTIDEVIRRIREILDKDCEKAYAESLQSVKNQEDAIQKAYRELGFKKEDQKIVEVIRDFIYLRTQRKDSMSEAAYNIRWVFEEIAGNSGLLASDLVHLMPEEIKDLARNPGNGGLYQNEIGKRKKGFALITYEGKTRIFSDESEAAVSTDSKNTKKVCGLCTFPGEVRAPARRVIKKSEIETTKDGEIMVTPTTSPDYVVIIDKLEGIVTDEGGVTCHAAQISREYKIPCIIGTGNATEVFNSGEQVYLNATKGFAEVE